MNTLTMWWTAQPAWVRLPLTDGAVVAAALWLYVAWLYRPRRRVTPAWAGATEGWSPKTEAGHAGPSEDMTAAAIEHARHLDAVVRVEVAERLDLEQRQADHAIAVAGTDFEMASIDLEQRCGRIVAGFTARSGRILSAWEDTASWSVAAPAARPVRAATGKRARRDRKREHQGKAVMV